MFLFSISLLLDLPNLEQKKYLYIMSKKLQWTFIYIIVCKTDYQLKV